ncbi:MAG: hydroxyethylthiazole kinase-like uncharacterized protein yjeF [Kiritimatiellia bacterium]|jgi:hydroxyethylthiazole kinase-like uncharacterized protein yjeF
MIVVSTAQMMEMDRLMTSEFGVSGFTLMDRAGFGVAEIVDELAEVGGFSDGTVRLVAGKGNNGGDVYVAARYLKERDYDVDVLLAGSRGHIKGDALKHLEAMKQAGIRLTEVSSPDAWDALTEEAKSHDGIVVDGVLGTGIRGPARGNAAGAIRFINAHRHRCPIVAVDVPSGMHSDTGEALGDTVVADLTVTMALPKSGLVQPAALPFVGSVDVVDIGFDDALVARYGADSHFISGDDCRRTLVVRQRGDHKGTFGHVLIVGGSDGLAGAIILAARAAVRSGAGLVSVLVPDCIQTAVVAAVPEAMVFAASSNQAGAFAPNAIAEWRRDWSAFSAVAVGPGMTAGDGMEQVLADVLERATGPVVIDADALNVLARHPGLASAAKAGCLLTPHPGEMARLLETTIDDVQARRFECAEAASSRWKASVVLKGAGTIVASPNKINAVNLNGNPGMARGGMGDALAGLLGGLVAQGMNTHDAACLAVYLHGRAGDRVAWSSSQAGMNTSDVIEAFAATFAELSPR